MAGIFRQLSYCGDNKLNSNNNNSNNETPSKKRYSIGAFCTSPSTLQDVTMDNSYGVGYRSPCVSLNPYQGSMSPASQQGRSVREFEEQMVALRKENFNLKLRLFFLEESIPNYQHASSSGDGPENLMKQLIDLKVEIEILRKELQEKQELLKEAAAAVTQMEKIQQDTEAKGESMVEELKQKIQYLEMDIERTQASGEVMDNILGRSNITDNVTTIQKVRELEGLFKQSEERSYHYQTEINKMNSLIEKRDETIKELEDKVKEQAFQNAELLEQLEQKEKAFSTAENENHKLWRKNNELINLQEDLENAKYKHNKGIYEIMTNRDNDVPNIQSNNFNKTQHLRQELQEHKSALADKLCMLEELEEKLEATKEKLQERTEIHEKACHTIKKLMSNMKRQQEKIDQLEKSKNYIDEENLSSDAVYNQQQHECRRQENKLKEQEAIIEKLQAEVQKKTTNLQSLVNHELWEKNREIERLTKLVNQSALFSPNNTTDLNNTNAVASKSANELKHLLEQCDLGVAFKDPCAVNENEQAVNNELRMELEKVRNEADNAEKWRRECADVCTVLSNRLEELAGFLNSLLKQKDVLGVLAADRRRAIRKAVDRSLDLSKSLNMTLSFSGLSMCDQSLVQLSNLSDILGEVEQNRTYNSHEETEADLQAIESLKAENKALKRELDKRRQKERRSLPLAPLKSNQSESEAWSEPDRNVSLARIGLLENEQTSSVVKDTDSDSDDVHQQNRSVANKMHTMELRITYLEQLLSERDERILETQSQLVHVDTLLKRETLRVLELEQQTTRADVESLQHQIEEKAAIVTQLQDERDRITVEARFAESQINVLKGEMEKLSIKHAQSLQAAEEQQQLKLKQLQHELEERLKVQQQLHAENLQQDWVSKQEHEVLQNHLEQLQQQVRQQNYNLENLHEQEEEYKESLLHAELSERALKKQLEESTLQASKAVVERTKAIKEKLQLEQRVQELHRTLQAYEQERASLQQQINKLENVQKQWQTVKNEQNESKQSQSGYTSEELAQVAALPVNKNKGASNRGNNTSSPDLGIESDAGRLSGVDSTKACGCSRNIYNNNRKNNTKEELSDGPEENMVPINEDKQQLFASGTATNTVTTTSTTGVHDCSKLASATDIGTYT